MPASSRSARGSLPPGYGRLALATLRASIRVLRPAQPPFDRVREGQVLRDCLSFVPYMPAPARWGLPLGLCMLELAPALFGFGFTRFSSLERDRAAEYLGRVAHARAPLSTVYVGLRSLVLIVFYQQPEVLSALGVDWQRRADELTARRARLAAMPADLANPRNAASGGGGRA